MKGDRLEVGDLVRLQNSNDPDRQIGSDGLYYYKSENKCIYGITYLKSL